jgi:putative intracellular protease/amidase
MHTQRVLLVVTSADRVGKSAEPTGFWLEEVAGPYYAFIDAKCDVTIVSPLGGQPPIDPTSLQEEHATASTRRFEVDEKAQHKLKSSLKLSSLKLEGYDAVFFAGGHGTMNDFATDDSVKAAVEHFYRAGKPVASVCHGPACLVRATKRTGDPVVKGHRFSCFSDIEEKTIGADGYMPFLLESRLKEQGGTPQMVEAFQPQVVVDRQLITGQNPASSIPTAEAVIHALRQQVAA